MDTLAKAQRGRPAKDFSLFSDIIMYLPILVKVWEADGNVTQAARNLEYEGTKSIYHARTQLRKYVNKERPENDPHYDRLFFYDDNSGEIIWTEKGIELVREGQQLLKAQKRVLDRRKKRSRLEYHYTKCKTPIYRYGKILLEDFPQITKPKIELVYMCKNCLLILGVLKTLEFTHWRNLHSELFIGSSPAFLQVEDPNLKLG